MRGLSSNSNLRATQQSSEMSYQLLHREVPNNDSLVLNPTPVPLNLNQQLYIVPTQGHLRAPLHWEWRHRTGGWCHCPGERWQQKEFNG